jgi:hypothetical protein
VGAPLDRRDMLRALTVSGASATMGFSPYVAEAFADPAHDVSKLRIGMNLTGVSDWDPGFPFVNLMWGARPWLTRNADGRGEWNSEQIVHCPCDEQGYPLEVPFRVPDNRVAQFVFTILPNDVKPGLYVVLYDGEGDIRFGGGSRALEKRPGRFLVDMRHKGGDNLEEIWITRSQRGNHIRNLRILPVDQEKADLKAAPFRKEVVEFCRDWHCLRFMDWQETNNSCERSWAERKRVDFYTQRGVTGDATGLFGEPIQPWQRRWASGVALDLCIQLANTCRTHAWVCVPHLADDAYIQDMAKTVRDTLDPSLKVYVEYSNEIWNWQFFQAQWMLRSKLASDLVVAAGDAAPWKDGKEPTQFKDGVAVPSSGDGSDHPVRTAALFRRCFKIWEEVFIGDRRNRLVRVCAVQTGWPDTAKSLLAWVQKNGGCDALAISGYFGPNEDIYKRWEQAGDRLTAGDVIADMEAVIIASHSEALLLAAAARDAGLKLVIYEGGQHIQPKDQAEVPYLPALKAAQTNPGMYDLYRRHLEGYARLDADVFCAFSSVGRQGLRWGSWGHVERYGQDPQKMPKYRALLDANQQRS